MTIHPKIFRAREDFLKWEILNPDLVNLEKFISENDSKKIIEIMEKLVSGYKPSAIIQDLFSRKKIEK